YSDCKPETEIARSYFFFFFFQAEDGIRDGHVTGVQTCALPISNFAGRSVKLLIAMVGSCDGKFGHAHYALVLSVVHAHHFLQTRSEERRVGKECRSRWWAEH